MIANSFRQKIASVFSSGPKAEMELPQKIYNSCLQASRRPEFYTSFDVADTFDGRFDMLCLIMSIYIQRLNQDTSQNKKFSQNLFDIMFKDIDVTLREMGAGDLGVGKRVKIMSESFLGRLTKYCDNLTSRDSGSLAESLSRNLYRQEGYVDEKSPLINLVFKIQEHLAKLPIQKVMSEEFNMNDVVLSCLSGSIKNS